METKKHEKKTLNQLIDEKIEAAIADAVSKLPQKIEQVINASIISVLGLAPSGREIDHCNGRWNMFAEVLKAEAAKDVVKIVKNIKTKFDFDKFKDAFQTEYISHFNYQLKFYAKQKAEEMAKSIIAKRIDELVPKRIERPL